MRRPRRIELVVLVSLLAAISSRAEMTEEDPTDLVDGPTASLLPHGAYDTSLRLYAGGGVLFRWRVGIRDAVHLGASFGGTNIVGSGDPDWNPRVEFLFRALLLRQTYYGPALAVGFDSQGYGAYSGAWSRYRFKSRGFYAVASKHFLFLGDLGFHGGANYSLERGDGQKNLNAFFGIEKSLHPRVDLLVEYDLAANDSKDDGVFGEGKGYLNAALVWRISSSVCLEADFRNLLENGSGESGNEAAAEWSRELQIIHRQYF
ncbi:MAG: hypothetical protein FJY73_00175 [Candidatus Eisenbacteria bacterium]|nr:hypothetical protein [Candidatus Eisenbacteria bacterium]